MNVSLPVGMYKEAKILIDKGLYGSFSEMVRSGIRNEMDLQKEINPDFVKSMKAAEKGGIKKFKHGKDLLKDLHEGL